YAMSCDALYAALAGDPRLEPVSAANRLNPFESASLLLALAPDVDPRYERIVAYLQDDVTRKRPTAALALDLFCRTGDERLDSARRLSPGATLFHRGLLEARPSNAASWLSAPLVVDSQLLRHLRSDPGLDPKL